MKYENFYSSEMLDVGLACDAAAGAVALCWAHTDGRLQRLALCFLQAGRGVAWRVAAVCGSRALQQAGDWWLETGDR